MKRLLYGAIPYYLTKIFSSHSPSLKYYLSSTYKCNFLGADNKQ